VEFDLPSVVCAWKSGAVSLIAVPWKPSLQTLTRTVTDDDVVNFAAHLIRDARTGQ
jgi:hypothetical protein